MRLSDVKAVNKKWFSPGNKKFFGDISYQILKAKSGNHYLVQKTCKFSDMFGRTKQIYYVLHLINDDLKLQSTKDGEDDFRSLNEVKEYLKHV